jgi:phosphoribosylanthranilate isomerase
MIIKICGITRIEDAQLAIELGADAIGFIFAPKSPRCISPETAREIIKTLPSKVEKIGVFVNASLQQIHSIRKVSGISMAQLHGDESPDFAATLNIPYIKALKPKFMEELSKLKNFPSAAMNLIDAYHPTLAGGTGSVADLQLAKAAKAYGPLMLAGGLSDQNILAILNEITPHAIDLSSSLELSPGIKCPNKLRSFFKTVRPYA